METNFQVGRANQLILLFPEVIHPAFKIFQRDILGVPFRQFEVDTEMS